MLRLADAGVDAGHFDAGDLSTDGGAAAGGGVSTGGGSGTGGGISSGGGAASGGGASSGGGAPSGGGSANGGGVAGGGGSSIGGGASSGGGAGGGGVVDAGCPAEMVTTHDGGCIDRYEAFITSEGTFSRAGVFPANFLTSAEEQAACALMGKHVCTEAEWVSACEGPSGFRYPYGNTSSSTACNGLDALVHGPSLSGQFTNCVGGYPGLFDLSGNLAERTSTCDGGTCRVHGGSYLTTADGGLDCTTGFDVPASNPGDIGFRCCR